MVIRIASPGRWQTHESAPSHSLGRGRMTLGRQGRSDRMMCTHLRPCHSGPRTRVDTVRNAVHVNYDATVILPAPSADAPSPDHGVPSSTAFPGPWSDHLATNQLRRGVITVCAPPLNVTAAAPRDDDDALAIRDAAVRAARALLTPEQRADVVISRVFIESAKGWLMWLYDLDDDNAFELLRWWSQAANVKLRVLARLLTEELAGFAYAEPEMVRSTCEDLLFTTPNAAARRPVGVR